MEVSDEDSVTAVPPDGAAWLSVTVPVELTPPATLEGEKVTLATVDWAKTGVIEATERRQNKRTPETDVIWRRAKQPNIWRSMA
jgi:hypothetical protein